MTTTTREDVLRALGRVIDPELGRDLVSLGMISDVQVENGDVEFSLHLTTPAYCASSCGRWPTRLWQSSPVCKMCA